MRRILQPQQEILAQYAQVGAVDPRRLQNVDHFGRGYGPVQKLGNGQFGILGAASSPGCRVHFPDGGLHGDKEADLILQGCRL